MNVLHRIDVHVHLNLQLLTQFFKSVELLVKRTSAHRKFIAKGVKGKHDCKQAAASAWPLEKEKFIPLIKFQMKTLCERKKRKLTLSSQSYM